MNATFSLSEIVLLVALMTNLSGLVWGAATIAAAVKQLKEGFAQMNTIVQDHDGTLNNHETRITVLEKVS